MTTATARSTRLPRRMNARNSRKMLWIRAKLSSGADGPLGLLRRHRRLGADARAAACPRCCVRRGGDRMLFDCGEGTQRQLLRSVGLPDLGAVFLTHLHVDHWLGLPGMLKTFDLRDRERRSTSTARRGTAELMRAMRGVYGRLRLPVRRRRARGRRRGRVRRLRDRRLQRPPPRARRSATRSSRTPARALRRRRCAERSACPSARTSGACSAARRSTACAPEQVIGPERARPQDRHLRRHRAVRDAARRRPRGRRAGPRGDVRRGRARAGAPRPATRRPARRPRSRATRACGCSR